MDRWQDELSTDELQTSPVLDRFKSPEDAYKAVIEAAAYRGDSIRIPADDSGDEIRTEFVNKLRTKVPELMPTPKFDTEDGAKSTWSIMGRPDDEDGYILPEDVKGLPDELVAQVKGLAVASGLTLEQYHTMLGEYAEANDRISNQQVLAKEEHTTALKALWGPAYEQNIGITDALIARHDEKHPDNPLGEINNAARVFIMDMAKALTSDPQAFDQIMTPNAALTPAEIRAELSSMRRSEIYLNKTGKYTKEERTGFLNKYNGYLAQLAEAPG